MKLQLLLTLLLTSQLTSAQYQVELSNEPYVELTGATELTYDASQGGYYHAVNLNFPVFRRTADLSLQPTVPSNGAYITPSGYFAVYEKPGYKNTIIFHCLYSNDFDYMAGKTKVSVKMEGSAPNRVVKIQWKDMVYKNDANQTASAQAWLHENTGNIAFHYGQNSVINAAATPFYAGLMVANEDFSLLVDQLSLKGSPTSKETSTGYTTLTMPPMTGAPTDGSVITFKRYYTTVNDVQDSKHALLYPNPASECVYLNIDGGKQVNVRVVDVSGAEVFSNIYNSGNVAIPLANISNGLYFVQLQTPDGVMTKRLVVNK